jgi:chemotaxis protein histidine kinase CheA/CheY-like chemotaxis protein
VLEAIEDPLIHLIRNAIDHGIESAEEREAAGKPAKGTLSITARHMGDAVELTIADDGAGIDPERIRQSLIAKQIVDQEQALDLTGAQLYDYLFESGFSTHEDVSKLSGRGVGLDVVKYTVEGLGGEVHLASQRGHGTSIGLRLPLAMSTVRCLLVAAAGRPMALPAANVERVVVPRAEQLQRIGGGEVIVIDDRNVPYLPLDEVLALRGDATSERSARPAIAVVVTFGERRVAFAVDEILEYSQLIIKPLGDLLERVPNISGISLLSTGELALVLNPADLVRSAGSAADGLGRRDRATPERSPESVTILVVDDSIATRTLEKTLLESAGFNVITAEDGYKALNRLGQTACDLVISDVQMPNMDGIELTRTIKARETLAHLPVILVTSLGSDEDKARGLSAGADAYVVKKELSPRC